jgi:hypothetical protein
MNIFNGESGAENVGESLTFDDRSELLRFSRTFDDTSISAETDQMAMELHSDMANVATRLATAMYRNGEIEPGEFEAVQESAVQMTLDQATQWAEELEAEVREKQLVGVLPENEELDATLEAALAPPVVSVQEMVEAQVRALHEQAGVYGMSAQEIADAEQEIRESTFDLLEEENREDEEPPLKWAA